MDLNKLHYFFAAAELQNFTRAAQSCHIAQTTMSKYIAVLEQELGCPLFVRSRRTARLTPQGQQFYDGMKPIEEQYQALCQRIRRAERRELRIGMLTTDYEDFPILRSFELARPDIAVYFSFGEENRLLTELEQHRLDALICPHILLFSQTGQRGEGIARADLVTIAQSLVCSRELLDRYGSLSAVIESQPFLTKAVGTGYQEFCREKLRALYGASFRSVTVANSYSHQLLLLNLSRGFAIIPSLAQDEYENLVFFPAPEVFYETEQLLYQREHISPELDALLQHIHEKKC